MSRRGANNIIKLEALFGADRQTIIIRRNQELVVRDIMEEVQNTFDIPIREQVIFHKGTNLTDHMDTRLEVLGIENNHKIKVNRDIELPIRSPRSKIAQHDPLMGPKIQSSQNNMDAVSYLKEIAPQRVPDPTPYQVQVYK